jgi:predicted RNase H-like nuclease (RuvC/YqgF family)
LQRQLRLSDAKAVEAKAARIKDWVTNKLRELEEQNAHLKAQNAKASDQMELLRNRLEQLQAFNATTAAITKNGKGRSDSMAEVGTQNII